MEAKHNAFSEGNEAEPNDPKRYCGDFFLLGSPGCPCISLFFTVDCWTRRLKSVIKCPLQKFAIENHQVPGILVQGTFASISFLRTSGLVTVSEKLEHEIAKARFKRSCQLTFQPTPSKTHGPRSCANVLI